MLQKHTPTATLKLTVPTHRPLKRSTLSPILKQAKLTVEEFDGLLQVIPQKAALVRRMRMYGIKRGPDRPISARTTTNPVEKRGPQWSPPRLI